MLLTLFRKIIDFIVPSNRKNMKPTYIPYTFNQGDLCEHGLKVIRRLRDHGFEAYFVGGCIRDLLLGEHPKDFDVVTNARPEQICKVFHNARIIGRRFTLVHIRFRNELIEVATFRRDQSRSRKNSHGVVLSDNHFGELTQDVWRRDFTVNALYYDPAKRMLIDYVNGYQDILSRRIKSIGVDKERFAEDPVRMLRAIRYGTKLDLSLSDEVKKAIQEQAHLLEHVAKARLYEEFLKSFSHRDAHKTFGLVHSLGISKHLIPGEILEGEAFKQIKKSLKWFGEEAILKEHTAFCLMILFILPAVAHIPAGKKRAQKIAQYLEEFDDLIMVPNALEYNFYLALHDKEKLPNTGKKFKNQRTPIAVLPKFEKAQDFVLMLKKFLNYKE